VWARKRHPGNPRVELMQLDQSSQASVLCRMTGTDEHPVVVTLLRRLAPISTRPGLEASAM
jgi:hypothetical protein